MAGLWIAAYWANGRLWDAVFYDVLGMPADERLTETLHFSFYDTVKIALLLSGIIFVITILRSYMSIERTRAMLGGITPSIGAVGDPWCPPRAWSSTRRSSSRVGAQDRGDQDAADRCHVSLSLTPRCIPSDRRRVQGGDRPRSRADPPKEHIS